MFLFIFLIFCSIKICHISLIIYILHLRRRKFYYNRRGGRSVNVKKKKHKSNFYDDGGIAERAAFVLDKSLEEQALMYELFEAKKKEQAQKVKVNKYFMKYGKHY